MSLPANRQKLRKKHLRFENVQPPDPPEVPSSSSRRAATRLPVQGPSCPPPPPPPPLPPSHLTSPQREEPEQATNSISDRDEMTEPARGDSKNNSRIMSSSMCYLKGAAVWPMEDPLAIDIESCESQQEGSRIPVVRAIGVPFAPAEEPPGDGQVAPPSGRHVTRQPSVLNMDDIKNLCFATVVVLSLTLITSTAIVCGGGYCASTRNKSLPSPATTDLDPQRLNFSTTTTLMQTSTHNQSSSPLPSPPGVNLAPTIHPTNVVSWNTLPTASPIPFLSPEDPSFQPTHLPLKETPSVAPSIFLIGNSNTLLPVPAPPASPQHENNNTAQPTIDPELDLEVTTNSELVPGFHPTTASPASDSSATTSPTGASATAPSTVTTAIPTTEPHTTTNPAAASTSVPSTETTGRPTTEFHSTTSPTSAPTAVPSTATTGPTSSASPTATISPTAEAQPLTNTTDDGTMVSFELGDSGASILVPGYTIRSLATSESAQSRALDYLSNNYGSNALQAMPQWRRQQLFAMMSLFYSLDGDALPHYSKASWMDPSISECYWQGDFDINRYRIDSCSKSRQIKELKLHSPHDASSPSPKTIPPELELLSFLEVLHVDFAGIQPSPLARVLSPRLNKLRSLSLPATALSGQIPSYIGEFKSMQAIQLFGNTLSGSIPSQIGLLPDLDRLWLNGNGLSAELPSQLGNLTNLRHLKLNGNNFSSTLPTDLGLLTKMTRLSLGYNSFVGQIPSELGLLTDLQDLDLSGNEFSGMVPDEICELGRQKLRHFLVDCSKVFCPDRCTFLN